MSAVPAISPRSRAVLVFSVELAVFDEAALALAARIRAREDGLCDEAWASMRSGMPDDLVMLLDPGLVEGAGLEILQSTCEVCEASETSEASETCEVNETNGHVLDQR